MKRTFLSLILCILLVLSLAPGAWAASLSPVIDQAELLTAQQEESLTQKADALRDAYGMDFVIVTNHSLGRKTPEQYADDYFDDNGYGPDGVLFLLSMEQRDWYISTCGDGIYALTDYGIQQLGELAVGYLADGRYYDAFDAYLDALVPYLESFQKGAPIDGQADLSGDFYHGTQEKVVHYGSRTPSAWSRFLRGLPMSMFIGLIAAGVTILILRSSMNTKRRQTAASAYMVDDSFHLRRHRDLFLYSNVSKVRRQQNTSSGSSHSGGGSSVHHSSSGRSHGGGGGKF